MNRLEGRVVRLERGGRRNGWRACASVPVGQWPDDALLGSLAESEGWPPGYDPTDEELRVMASLAAGDGEDGAA